MINTFLLITRYLFGLFAIGTVFSVLLFATGIEIKDLDLWLHLASGKYILENLTIPHFDIFSFTINNQVWMDHEWLFQVVVAKIYSLWGFDGLINLQTFVVAMTFLVLLRIGFHPKNLLPITAGLFVALLVYETRFTIRPDIFSVLFLSLFLLVLNKNKISKATLFFLVLIQILWANMHGFFILGPLTVVSFWLGEYFRRRNKLKNGCWDEGDFKRLGLLLLLTLFIPVLNPYMIDGALYPWKVLFSLSGDGHIFFKYIKELERPLTNWQALLRWDGYLYLKISLWALIFVALVGWKTLKLEEIFLSIIFCIIGLSATRNMVYLSLISFIIWVNFWNRINLKELLLKHFCLSEETKNILIVILLGFLIFVIHKHFQRLTVRGYFDFSNYERKSEYGGVSLRNFPEKAVDYLIDNKIKGNFFNDFNSGAYLIGRVFPDIHVYLDGRTEMYGAKYFTEYRDVLNGDIDLFEKLNGKYCFDGIFLSQIYVPPSPRLLRYLYASQDWALVYFDYDAIIFIRNSFENQTFVETQKVDLANWKVPKFDLLKLGVRDVAPYQYINRGEALMGFNFWDKAKAEAVEALRISSQSMQANRLLAKVFIQNEAYHLAYEYARKAKVLDLNDTQSRYLLALSFYYLNDIEQSRNQLDFVFADGDDNAKAVYLKTLLDLREGKFEDAQKNFVKAYDISPYFVDDLKRVVDAWIEVNNFDQALFVLGKIDLKEQDTASVQFRYGLSYKGLGQIVKANEAFDRARILEPHNSKYLIQK